MRRPRLYQSCSAIEEEEGLCKCIHNLIVDTWNSETMPNDWTITILCPFHKEGNKMESSNCRGISLLNIIYKIFSNILDKYIEPHVEQSFRENQSGFHRNWSTTGHIFTLHMIYKKFNEYNKYLHQLYVDFTRLTPFAGEIFKNYECECWRNRSPADHIFCIRQILEKKWEYNEAVHKLFAFVWHVSYYQWFATRRWIITIAFQLCCRVHH